VAHIQQQTSGNSFVTTFVDTLNMLINSIHSIIPACPIRCSNLTVQNLFAPPPPTASSTLAVPNLAVAGATIENVSLLHTLNVQALETVKSIDTFHRHQLLTLQEGGLI
jgi:hypothetical protein